MNVTFTRKDLETRLKSQYPLMTLTFHNSFAIGVTLSPEDRQKQQRRGSLSGMPP